MFIAGLPDCIYSADHDSGSWSLEDSGDSSGPWNLCTEFLEPSWGWKLVHQSDRRFQGIFLLLFYNFILIFFKVNFFQIFSYFFVILAEIHQIRPPDVQDRHSECERPLSAGLHHQCADYQGGKIEFLKFSKVLIEVPEPSFLGDKFPKLFW